MMQNNVKIEVLSNWLRGTVIQAAIVSSGYVAAIKEAALTKRCAGLLQRLVPDAGIVVL